MSAEHSPGTGGRPAHPLGPRFLRTAPADHRSVRCRAGVCLLACASLLGVAGWLKPAASATGTHTQLGLAECSWLINWDIPCPTCGMTTAFAYAARGRWLAAVRAQPAGFLLAVAVMLGAATSIHALSTGRTWRVNWYRLSPAWLVAATVGMLVCSWAYKILATRSNMG